MNQFTTFFLIKRSIWEDIGFGKASRKLKKHGGNFNESSIVFAIANFSTNCNPNLGEAKAALIGVKELVN